MEPSGSDYSFDHKSRSSSRSFSRSYSHTGSIEKAGNMYFEAVTRTVKQGCEAEYRSKLENFFAKSKALFPKSEVYLINPLSEDNLELGLIRSFVNEEQRNRFYQSEHFQNWVSSIENLTQGSAKTRKIHGLEAFFQGQPKAPAHWKMIILTWLAVCISVAAYSHTIVPVLKPYMNPVLLFLTANMLVVLTLALILMPLFVKMFAGWLHPKS